MIKIIPFEAAYAKDFERLNVEWLEKYFVVEAYDRKVLANPKEYIIDPGGVILFAKYADDIVGTVALMKDKKNHFELTKMAVTEAFKGQKIGEKLMLSVLQEARLKNLSQLYLITNSSLIPAISLYKKVGFKEVPMLQKSIYVRGDVKMEITL